MGKRNRERRTAKQKHRRRCAKEQERNGSDPPPDRAQILERLVIALSTAASVPAPWRAAELLEQLRGYERELDVAADLAVHEAIRTAWVHGWSPTDLHEVARRRVDAATVRYLDEAIVLESQRYSVPTLHPRWRAELADIAAAAGPESAPQMRRWAASHSGNGRAALTTVLQVLHLLGRIPRSNPCFRCRGRTDSSSAVAEEVDEKMLARVRALLAKAEATEYPDEAEALSAKAQALMVRHSLTEAVADHARGRTSTAAGRRIWIDNPYVGAKVALVQAVAQANRCPAVWIKESGLCRRRRRRSPTWIWSICLQRHCWCRRVGPCCPPDADTTFGGSRARSHSGSLSWSLTLPASASGSRPPVRRSPKNSARRPTAARAGGPQPRGRRDVQPAVSENGRQPADGLRLCGSRRRTLRGGHSDARRPRRDRGLIAARECLDSARVSRQVVRRTFARVCRTVTENGD